MWAAESTIISVNFGGRDVNEVNFCTKLYGCVFFIHLCFFGVLSMVTTFERFQVWINFEIRLRRKVLICFTVFDSVPHKGTQLFLMGTDNVQDHSEMVHSVKRYIGFFVVMDNCIFKKAVKIQICNWYSDQLLNILTISSIFSTSLNICYLCS